MKNKFFKRLVVGIGALCLGLSLMATPAATIPAEAAVKEGDEINKEAIEWIYVFHGNEVWKRLFNHSTGQWIGNWIFVRYLD